MDSLLPHICVVQMQKCTVRMETIAGCVGEYTQMMVRNQEEMLLMQVELGVVRSSVAAIFVVRGGSDAVAGCSNCFSLGADIEARAIVRAGATSYVGPTILIKRSFWVARV